MIKALTRPVNIAHFVRWTAFPALRASKASVAGVVRNMNRIEAIECKSKFARKKHLVIAVDGKSLDLLLEDRFCDESHIGLFPAISWLDIEEERAIAINKICPASACKSIAPILVCPDDQDFSRTVIVAEVVNRNNSITWQRVGVDKTPLQNPPKIGLDVEWYDNVPSMTFDLRDYRHCMEELEREEA